MDWVLDPHSLGLEGPCLTHSHLADFQRKPGSLDALGEGPGFKFISLFPLNLVAEFVLLLVKQEVIHEN